MLSSGNTPPMLSYGECCSEAFIPLLHIILCFCCPNVAWHFIGHVIVICRLMGHVVLWGMSSYRACRLMGHVVLGHVVLGHVVLWGMSSLGHIVHGACRLMGHDVHGACCLGA